MSQISAGTVVIGLRADLATLQSDMAKASSTTSAATRKMASAMRANVTEGTHSLRFFGEAMGVHDSRPIARVIAQSKLLGPALSAAFGGAAALAIGMMVWEKIGPKIKEATDYLAGWGEANQEAYKEQIKVNDSLAKMAEEGKKLDEQFKRIGLSSMQVKQLNLKEANAALAEHEKKVRKLGDEYAKLAREKMKLEEAHGGELASTGAESVMPIGGELSPEAQGRIQQLEAEISSLGAELLNLQKQSRNAAKELKLAEAEEGRRNLEAANAAAKQLGKTIATSLQSLAIPANDPFAAITEQKDRALVSLAKSYFEAREAAVKAGQPVADLDARYDRATATVEKMTAALVRQKAALEILETRGSVLKSFGIELSPKTPLALPPSISSAIQAMPQAAMPKLAVDPVAQAMARFNNYTKEQADFLNDVTKKTLTYSQALAVEKGKLDALVAAHLISPEQEQRAIQVFTESLDKAMKKNMDSVDGFFQYYIDSARNTGRQAAQIMQQAFSGFEKNLADTILGKQKKNAWSDYFGGMASKTMESGIHTALGAGMKALGLGGFGKKDGSSPSRALYVQFAGAASLLSGGAVSGGADSMAKAGGGIAGFLAKLFGGGHAGGGDIFSDRFYLTGEKGPELVGGMNGHVFSNSQSRSMLGGGGSPTYYIDARDADAAAIDQRVNRALVAVHGSAIRGGFASSQEWAKRRPKNA
jgi:hypothetical protein